jgi:hypothetical protein
MSEPDGRLLFGYLVKEFLTPASEVQRAKARLISFARQEGSVPQAIFVEEALSASAAFEALLERSKRNRGSAVLVLSEAALAPRTPAGLTRRQQLEQEAGGVVVTSSPE